MSSTFYNRGLDDLSDWESGSFVWILAKPTYTPDRDHDFIDDVTNEVTVASYGRIAPTSPDRSVDNTNDRITYTCSPPDFGDLEDTETARWLILARDVTTDADSPLILALDLGEDGVPLGDDFVVHFPSSGFAVDRQVPV